MKNKRSIQNLILAPRLQMPFALYSTLATLLFVAASIGVLTWVGNDSISLILALTDAPKETQDVLNSVLSKSTLLISALAVIFVLINFSVSLFISHRMVGPVIQFLRHVKALKDEDYSSRVNIRPKDGFYDLAGALNELAESLEEKNKSES